MDLPATVAANKASMQQSLDPFAGVKKQFNLVPAMPLMEIFLAKECEVHRSRVKTLKTAARLVCSTIIPHDCHDSRQLDG